MEWAVALIFGAIIIVTGPTVIMPLLKQANLKRRPAVLHKYEIPVLLNDSAWQRLNPARMQNIPTHYREILSERTETQLLALTPNEAYNTLACSRFAPELGYRKVHEIGWRREKESAGEAKVPSKTIRGYAAFEGDLYYDDFCEHFNQGWRFQGTNLTEQFGRNRSHPLFLQPTETGAAGNTGGSFP